MDLLVAGARLKDLSTIPYNVGNFTTESTVSLYSETNMISIQELKVPGSQKRTTIVLVSTKYDRFFSDTNVARS